MVDKKEIKNENSILPYKISRKPSDRICVSKSRGASRSSARTGFLRSKNLIEIKNYTLIDPVDDRSILALHKEGLYKFCHETCKNMLCDIEKKALPLPCHFHFIYENRRYYGLWIKPNQDLEFDKFKLIANLKLYNKMTKLNGKLKNFVNIAFHQSNNCKYCENAEVHIEYIYFEKAERKRFILRGQEVGEDIRKKQIKSDAVAINLLQHMAETETFNFECVSCLKAAACFTIFALERNDREIKYWDKFNGFCRGYLYCSIECMIDDESNYGREIICNYCKKFVSVYDMEYCECCENVMYCSIKCSVEDWIAGGHIDRCNGSTKKKYMGGIKKDHDLIRYNNKLCEICKKSDSELFIDKDERRKFLCSMNSKCFHEYKFECDTCYSQTNSLTWNAKIVINDNISEYRVYCSKKCFKNRSKRISNCSSFVATDKEGKSSRVKIISCAKCLSVDYCSVMCSSLDSNHFDECKKREFRITRFCDGCKKFVSDVSYCSGCENVKYCSVGCQKVDWKLGHKLICRPLSSNKKE